MQDLRVMPSSRAVPLLLGRMDSLRKHSCVVVAVVVGQDQVVLLVHLHQEEAVYDLCNSHLDDVAEAAEELSQLDQLEEVDKELHQYGSKIVR